MNKYIIDVYYRRFVFKTVSDLMRLFDNFEDSDNIAEGDVMYEIDNIRADLKIMHVMGVDVTPESLINFISMRRKMGGRYANSKVKGQ